MMRTALIRRATMAGVAVLALAACSKSGDVTVENATPAEVAQRIGEATRIEPGKWRVATKLLSMEMPGLPKAQADAARAGMAQASSASVETCITPEMARRPPGEMFAGAAEQNCRYDRFAVSGGRLDAVMTCRPNAAGGPSEVKVAISGEYGARKYDLTTAMTMTGGGPGGPGSSMAMKSRVTGENVGACDAVKGS